VEVVGDVDQLGVGEADEEDRRGDAGVNAERDRQAAQGEHAVEREHARHRHRLHPREAPVLEEEGRLAVEARDPPGQEEPRHRHEDEQAEKDAERGQGGAVDRAGETGREPLRLTAPRAHQSLSVGWPSGGSSPRTVRNCDLRSSVTCLTASYAAATSFGLSWIASSRAPGIASVAAMAASRSAVISSASSPPPTARRKSSKPGPEAPPSTSPVNSMRKPTRLPTTFSLPWRACGDSSSAGHGSPGGQVSESMMPAGSPIRMSLVSPSRRNMASDTRLAASIGLSELPCPADSSVT